jgi:hypothetical protein
MNVTEIPMSVDEAREHFRAYRNSVKDRLNEEDRGILRGYRAIIRGQRVINLRATIEMAGVNKQGLPKLAIMRADKEQCSCQVRLRSGDVTFSPDANFWRARSTGTIRVRGALPKHPNTRDWDNITGTAMVPPVPPHLQPKAHLRNYHTLWEAVWRRQPPADPILLKHCGGQLYAVLAQWDITPLEQAVLEGRF